MQKFKKSIPKQITKRNKKSVANGDKKFKKPIFDRGRFWKLVNSDLRGYDARISLSNQILQVNIVVYTISRPEQKCGFLIKKNENITYLGALWIWYGSVGHWMRVRDKKLFGSMSKRFIKFLSLGNKFLSLSDKKIKFRGVKYVFYALTANRESPSDCKSLEGRREH